MAGMVLGITVLPSHDARRPARQPTPPRQLTMVDRRWHERAAGRDDDAASASCWRRRECAASDARVTSPGPPLVLRRGEPVEITRSESPRRKPTSIHWHGLEIESYYDGVHGWSGAGPPRPPR